MDEHEIEAELLGRDADRSHSKKGKKAESHQFRALFYKNLSLQKRQWCLNCCQLVVPLLLVLIIGATEELFQHYVGDTFVPGKQIMTYSRNYSYASSVSSPDQFDMWYTSNADVGALYSNGTGYGLLGQVRQLNFGASGYMPNFEQQSSETSMQDQIDTSKNYYLQQAVATGVYPPRCDTCPRSALNMDFEEDQATNSTTLDYVLQIDTQLGIQPLNTIHTVLNIIDNAFLRYVTNNTLYQMDVFVQGMPYLQQPLPFDIAGFMSILLYPFAVSFLLPLYVSSIVLEKQERLRELMKMMGMKMRNYWVVNYLYDALLYTLVIGVIAITSLAFSMRIFTQTSWSILLLFFIGWGNAQIALGFLLTTLFSNARSSTIVSWLIVIAGVILSYVLNYTVFNNNDMPFWFYFFYAPFACYRGLYLIGVSCFAMECITWDQVEVGSQMFYILLFLYIDMIIYFVLALYLDQVLPSEYGVPKHPLFFMDPLKRYIQSKRSKGSESESEALIHKGTGGDFDEEGLDEDVLAERKRIHESRYPQDSPIVIHNLTKTYPSQVGQPEKKALKGLSLGISRGECFGLLGPNGAGKTTTISILTGLFRPTTGYAEIGGFDIRKNMDEVHRIMSVCPQFDILWAELTCEETLLFYARLKGVPRNREAAQVKRTLADVGLEQFPKRKSKDLSGGMRRRLSIGVALVGDPQVIFLDEPTTGLDPDTRRHLWEVLLRIKKGRCLILTTHSMEEADILSDRIGIMSKGQLRCIGSQLRLKAKFGGGYTFQINFRPEQAERAKAFVFDLFNGDAELDEEFTTSAKFMIREKNFKISFIFDEMERQKHAHGILDWGMSQTTMEDVFLAIVRVDESDISYNS